MFAVPWVGLQCVIVVLPDRTGHARIHKIPHEVGGGGGEVLTTFLVIHVVQRGTNLPREAIGLGSNCFSRGIHTSISTETYGHMFFQRGVRTPSSPLDPRMLTLFYLE